MIYVIGGSGGEYGARGWLAAYDAETGKEVWRFWTVPGDPSRPYEGDHLRRAALSVAAGISAINQSARCSINWWSATTPRSSSPAASNTAFCGCSVRAANTRTW